MLGLYVILKNIYIYFGVIVVFMGVFHIEINPEERRRAERCEASELAGALFSGHGRRQVSAPLKLSFKPPGLIAAT